MPLSELVFGALRPEIAKEGFAHIRTKSPRIFEQVSGNLSYHVAQIVRHNEKDISSEHKPVLGIGESPGFIVFYQTAPHLWNNADMPTLEWNETSDFHKFYPASEGFKDFIGVFAPYAAAKATPQLFEPTPGSASFKELFSKGSAQIFVAHNASAKKKEISGAWDELLASLNKDPLVGQWSGWGIEDDEGTWAAILGWNHVEVSLGVDFSTLAAY